MNFTDLRILRTQEQFQNALLELLETKQLKEISVKGTSFPVCRP